MSTPRADRPQTSTLSGLSRSRLASTTALAAALTLALQPLLVGVARAQVIVDPTAPIEFRPGIGISPRGAPVVDITAPSFGGLSHNKFERFDVDTSGVILNNSGLGGDSILGGRIGANPNLVGRQPARTILNEVTGTDPSRLGGPTEVFGTRADVIVANPNGVGCVGCTFVNAGRVTLSTGTPVPDYVRGTVDFEVRRGTIEISGTGLSAPAGMQPIADVDLVGRRIGLDGGIVASDRVRLRAGAITYDPGSDRATPLVGADALAGLAIAGTASGTIRAGSISILSRDVDLGIVLAGDLAAQADSIVVSSFGDVALGGTRADLDTLVDARGDVVLAGTHEAGRLLAVQGTDVTLDGRVAAGQAIAVEARGTLDSAAGIASGGAIGLLGGQAARVSGEIRAGGALGIEGGDVESRSLTAGATRIGIAARGDVRLDRTRLAAQSDVSISGRDVALGLGTAFGAPGRLDIGARRDFLNETVLEHPRLSLAIGRSFLNGVTGAYLDDTIALSLSGDLVNAGLIQARLLARIAARDLVVSEDGAIDAPDLEIALSGQAANAGVLQGRARLALSADALLNAAPGRILGDAITVRVDGGLTNLGAILAPETLAIVAGGLVGNDGTLASGGALTLTGASYAAGSPAARLAGASVEMLLGGGLDNAGAILAEDALAILAASARNRAGAVLRTLGDLDLTLAGNLVNDGAIDAGDDVALRVGGDLSGAGALVAGGGLAARIDGGLSVGGSFAAIGDLDLVVGADLVVGGLLAAQGRAEIDARALVIGADGILFGERVDLALRGNAQVAGSLLARTDLHLNAAGAIQSAGAIRAGGDLVLAGASYSGTSAAAELSGASADIAVAGAFATHGRVVGEAGLAIAAGSLVLHAGARASGAFVDLATRGDATIAGALEARDLVLGEIGGALAIAGSLRVAAQTGDIGLLASGPVTLLGTLSAPGRVVLAASALTNAGGLLSGGDVGLSLGGSLVNSGTILATGELSIGAGAVLNAGSSAAHAHLSGRILDIAAQDRVDAGAFSVMQARDATRIRARASNLDLFGEHGVAEGRFAFGGSLALALREQGLVVSAGQRIMAAGDLTLAFGGEISVLGTIAAGGDLALASTGGSIDLGGTVGGALLFTLSDARIEAAGDLRLASSAIEALGRIDIAAGGAVALGRTGGVVLQFSRTEFVQGGNLWQLDYFNQVETSPASLIHAGSDLTITAWSLDNHVSTIFAAGDMAISVGVLTNRVRNLQSQYNLYKLTGADTGFRGTEPAGTWSVTPATIQAGGALVIAASESLSNEGTMAGFSVGLSAPSVSVGIVDPNVYTAPPALPDPVIDLSRFAVATPGFVVNAAPVALVPGGARYLVTSPVPEAPRFDASGLPLPTREPTWILRQVGAVESDLVFLADPISERRLIARALAEQTGRVLLNPEWRDPITQQEALYEGTVAFLRANPEISLGRELTAAERARVEAPMLWYVERTLDGQRVLVPQLILPPADLARYAYDPAGSVLSATDLMITGDRVRNAGSLVARESLVIDAGSFLNEQRLATARFGPHTISAAQAGGNVLAGDLLVRTQGDLVSRGGVLFGETGVTLIAGGDVRLEAQAAFNDILIRERRWSQRTVTLEHSATRVGSGGDLTIVAGGAFALVGSSLTAEGDVAVTARDGITLSSVVDTIESTFTRSSRGFLRSSSSLDMFAAATHRGAAIGAGGDVTLLSGGDVLVVASDVAAGRDLLLAAGAGAGGRADASVTILAGTDTSASLSERRSSGFGLFLGGGRLDFYRSSLNRDETATRTNAPSTLIAGGDVTVLAPGDLTLAGSVVGAGGLATLSAGRDLLLLPGNEGSAQSSLAQRTGFGFGFSASGGSASLSFGLARSSIAAEAMRG
ncbi:filamentous hemagglutinin N-terminal domain-containing protein, partial [Salinarimonas sp.]|uniref:two-partner secretion domain-containing protein n=1 Tax=Salinarimonas sp. TaxID=2766526 RepID=UPI00391C975F